MTEMDVEVGNLCQGHPARPALSLSPPLSSYTHTHIYRRVEHNALLTHAMRALRFRKTQLTNYTDFLRAMNSKCKILEGRDE